MTLNLNECDKACVGCVRRYKGKHSLESGETFEITCSGIPDKERQLDLFSHLPPEERETAITILDPVKWAADVLDWHCLDPDGETWKRKNPDEYYKWQQDNPDEDILGHSRYHRPYQAEMLRCSAQYKVFRIGRQAGKTEAIVVSMLYHLFTQPGIPSEQEKGFEIVLLTPFQNQIELIFKRLLELIRGAPSADVANSVSRHVKAPTYTLELYNNSMIKGFTAGTKSGGNADSIRGQHAHMLVFDEADYLASGDMDSAFAIVTNFPNASVWMSSTPCGKREKFFETCYMRDWREFYYPSQVNPMYGPRLERLFRRQYSEIAYKHEVLADFGEQEEGVFQNTYIQRAKLDYEYGSIPYQRSWTYTIGVDWNDTKNGTTIVVLGYNPNTNKFQIMDRHTVAKEGWTQLLACERIAQLNRIWHPMIIYVDAGYGGTQYEILRKYGFDSSIDPTKGRTHPDSRLKDIVKQYKFGSKVEIRDLWTHEPVDKPAKPFLVESTVRRFEAADIHFPKSDEKLEKQLQGYIIKRVSHTGVPVYEAGNAQAGDHVLDALMLSVVGFILEATPLGKPRYDTNIAFSGYFGEQTEPLIHEGDLVIEARTRNEMEASRRDHSKPEMGRSEPVEQKTLLGTRSMPGNHLTSDKQLGLWAYPGFERDAPKPRARTMSEAERTARKRQGLSPSRGSRPRRRNV